MFKSFKWVEIMSGLASMKQRLKYAGGNSDGRIVKGKLKSLQAALWSSYQGEWITIDKRESKYPFRCLINPEKLTVDYNQKIISIEYEAGLKPGDTFLWNRTGKHFIVYTQFDEEEAYFRARIRQCDYYIVSTKKLSSDFIACNKKFNTIVHIIKLDIMFLSPD